MVYKLNFNNTYSSLILIKLRKTKSNWPLNLQLQRKIGYLYLSELSFKGWRPENKLFSFLLTAFFFIPFNLIPIVCWIGEMRIQTKLLTSDKSYYHVYIKAYLCIFSAFIAIANELLDKCNLPGKISRLEECSDNFFVGVYRGLLGDDLPGRVNNILIKLYVS